ncbi:MAG: hypothetical protein GY737_13825 [Desulfobacteraceae bacterium]|nr:hypothetical protein [Desulfobacteraceae bacterium]
MGWLDTISEGFDWIGDNKDTISTVGNLALGGYGLYQSNQAANTASDFYDAAGETTQQRWDLIEPLEQAKVDRELQNFNDRAESGIDRNQLYGQEVQTNLNNQILEFQNSLLPQQLDMQTELLRFQQEMMPEEEALYKSQVGVQQKALESTSLDIEQYEKWRPLEDQFYQESMEGIDPNQESDKAQADVAHAFAGTMEAANRELARRGVGPDGAGYQGKVNDNAVEQAKAIGSARTTARKYAEDVNYSRLGSAVNAHQRLAPATTGAITSPSAPVVPSTTAIQVPNFGGVNGGNPTNTYLALGGAAADGAAASSNAGWDLVQRGLNG